MELYYSWWPWLTSNCVARVCQHQLSFMLMITLVNAARLQNSSFAIVTRQSLSSYEFLDIFWRNLYDLECMITWHCQDSCTFEHSFVWQHCQMPSLLKHNFFSVKIASFVLKRCNSAGIYSIGHFYTTLSLVAQCIVIGPVCVCLWVPRVGYGVVRMDPLRFLAGCRTRRLNQV